MNPEQKAAVEVAEHLHSIEEFQRDLEPAIIAARNEFLTQETIVGRVQLSVYPSFCLKGLMHDE